MSDIRSTGILLTLLAAFSFSGTGRAANWANKTSEQASAVKTAEQAEDENRKKMRQANDRKLKRRDRLFPEQAKSLGKIYRETAEKVARQGGDPKPLLDAAAYFENQPQSF